MSASQLLRGFTSVLSGNLAVLGFNALLIFGLPLFLPPAEYGYWQLFQLYTLVLGYVTFGVTDGVQLRYAGRQYSSLEYPLFRTEFWLYLALILVVNVGIAAVYTLSFADGIRAEIMFYACVGAVLFIPRTLLTMTLQATFRMTAFSVVTAAERLIVVVLTFSLVFAGVDDVILLVQADVAGKAVALLLAMLVARRNVWGRLASARAGWSELVANGRAGTSVLIANLSAMLVPSVARWLIEARWSVEVFGSVSLAFNTANIVLVAVTSLAVAAFPWLRLLDVGRLREVYVLLQPLVMSTMISLLLLCVPLIAFASWALPAYQDGLRFLAIMFPMFVYEAQLRLVGTNYLKAVRREKILMIFNVVSVVAAALLGSVAAFVLHRLELVVLTVFVVTLLRATFVDATVRRVLGVKWPPLAVLELLVVVVFISATWWLETLPAFGCMSAALVVYWAFAGKAFVRGARGVRRSLTDRRPRPVASSDGIDVGG